MRAPTERQLGQFCGDTVPLQPDVTAWSLVEAAAARAPGAVAVEHPGGTLTYRALLRRADALAARLARAGVRRGDFVPLVMSGGPELLVAMLAVLRSAAVFVPLDEQWPGPRLRAMVDACGPAAVLLSPGAAPDGWSAPALAVDPVSDEDDPPADAAGAADAADAETAAGPASAPPRPEELAYGFYTSGSTGTPKCALNLHSGLANRLLAMGRRFGASPRHVVLQNSRHTFDSSLWQLLWPLTCGGRVVIPRAHDILDLTATVEVIGRHRVTMTDFVPTILTALVELLDSRPELVEGLASLRMLLVGGEEIAPDSVRALRRLLPQLRVTNTYGPTEASIGSVFHEVTPQDPVPLPIGRPIDNTWAVVLDEHGEPAPAGEIGEICIGGACLGTGYLGDPDRTALAFVENPFPELPGKRMYRTGDLGHRGPDGLLFFDGRRDQQVKIGGVRVELSEIEHAITSHPSVREAKVLVSEHGGGQHLAAFVTLRDGLTKDRLRSHVRALLPAELVPKRFIKLDAVPVNGNGKTDRRALAELLKAPAPSEASGWTTTGSSTERALGELWNALLPEPVTSPDADFFDSGGDSLRAQRLALAVSARFDTPLSIRDIVHAPTIALQAAALDGGRIRPPAPAEAAASAGDLTLPADIRPAGTPPSGPPRHLLLTGATGFIGAQLLHDLLERTDAAVHCLVRADTPDEARRRVADALHRYRLWSDRTAHRIHAVPGDLGSPRLGLAPADHHRLAEQADTVVHAGAMVNLVRGYGAHRRANVSGTVELLRLAAAGRPAMVHFVSTLAACPAEPSGELPVPELPVPAGRTPDGGYGQSKWVGEHLVQLAADRGMPVAVHRLGEVMPATGTGIPNPGSRVELLIRACLRVGAYFTSDLSTDYTPVDHVGRLLVAAVNHRRPGYFHLLRPGPLPLDDLLGAFGSVFGLRKVEYRDFWQAVQQAAAAEPDDRGLAGALALLPVPTTRPDRAPMAFEDAAARFSTARAAGLAALADARSLPSNRDGLHRYVVHHATHRG
ncbi:amino acid adenylation domain-containing protein [Kitasatospora sp. NPDC057692]|uniref:amino acid adenylation domain-containing protein n=1 Tax=Kitasatospora sp. NPDC057692 TaxID=3346215 RepID=UPI003678EBF1